MVSVIFVINQKQNIINRMESIDKIIQIVEKLEQDSIMLNSNNSKESINNLKDFAMLNLSTLRIAKNDVKNLGYSKVYEKLEKKTIESISRINKLL